ncbi:electron transport complex subunit E [Alteromonas ponticola]|uniref:Ion-translocating oxidoreductase complex subunit E n=1 Tax=Alteromonas aquimaris TaxID=2998417 RepID=A0ABT3P4P4_9ALTE|nr:electron transport complex subunit E [Alteromonas aquimaris]MCW8107751.1 electron transport complex subunit E [Alteromonas aquimaris]
MPSYQDLTLQGLWKNNPALVQLLGLCPLLAVTATFINGLGLGLATMLVLMGSNITVSLIRNVVRNEIRIPIFVMIIASFVTIVQLLMNAFTYELYLTLGIFIPLIVTNCAIIGRAEAFASKNSILPAAYDGLVMGTGFTVVLVVLGGFREVLGNGTLFTGADRLFGEVANNWQVTLFATDSPFLLAILPPGAFLGMGLLIACKNAVDAHLAARKPQTEKTITRARVTTEI